MSFELLLQTVGLPGILLLVTGLVIGTIWVMRRYLTHTAADLQMHKVNGHMLAGEKKYQELELTNYKPALATFSLVLSLGLVWFMFETPARPDDSLVNGLSGSDMNTETVMDVPVTQQTLPPPPPTQVTTSIQVVSNDEVIEDINYDLSVEIDQNTIIAPSQSSGAGNKAVVVQEEPKEEVAEEIFTVVEEAAEPKQGWDHYFAYVGEHLKYPRSAIRLGIEGKVYLRFVVNKDGTVSDISVLKGISDECDQEAVRVLQGAPSWKPGKQRGRAVRQWFTMPIQFRLQSRE
ncbi:MAG: energy transducer TonB [Bernardetiaceae bacterium]|jgi:protein TonB|nr:energy transducer TonB [Bernardetiaceae bacterium]